MTQLFVDAFRDMENCVRQRPRYGSLAIARVQGVAAYQAWVHLHTGLLLLFCSRRVATNRRANSGAPAMFRSTYDANVAPPAVTLDMAFPTTR